VASLMVSTERYAVFIARYIFATFWSPITLS
jgi:hypothetical protein